MTTQHSDKTRRSSLQVGDSTFKVKDHTVLTSANAAPVKLPGNIDMCSSCEFLTWGWWSTKTTVASGPAKGSEASTNLGTYVAGTLTTAVQMPQTGSATYGGGMVGNVNNNGARYIGSGNFNLNWNYANRGGVMTQKFDGATYSGNLSATPGSGGVSFNGTVAGAGRTGATGGSFYGNNAQNVGGTFQIGTNGSGYQASGTFAGKK